MQRDRFRSEEPNRSHEEGTIISRCRTKRLQIGRASPEWLSVLLDALFSVLAFAGAALNELDEPLPEARLEGSHHSRRRRGSRDRGFGEGSSYRTMNRRGLTDRALDSGLLPKSIYITSTSPTAQSRAMACKSEQSIRLR